MLGMMLFGTLDLNPEKSGNTQVGQTARLRLNPQHHVRSRMRNANAYASENDVMASSSPSLVGEKDQTQLCNFMGQDD